MFYFAKWKSVKHPVSLLVYQIYCNFFKDLLKVSLSLIIQNKELIKNIYFAKIFIINLDIEMTLRVVIQ